MYDITMINPSPALDAYNARGIADKVNMDSMTKIIEEIKKAAWLGEFRVELEVELSVNQWTTLVQRGYSLSNYESNGEKRLWISWENR